MTISLNFVLPNTSDGALSPEPLPLPPLTIHLSCSVPHTTPTTTISSVLNPPAIPQSVSSYIYK